MINKIQAFLGKISLSPSKFIMFISATTLPLLCVLCYIFFQFNKISKIESRLEDTYVQASKTKRFREFQKKYLDNIKENNFDLLQTLSSTVFLGQELHEIESLLKTDPFKDLPSLKNRYEFLKNNRNRLTFKIENTKEDRGKIYELEAKQTHPVEVSFEDLIYLLSNIENVSFNHHVIASPTAGLTLKKIEITKSKNATLYIKNLSIIKKAL